ncbi:hypothetical protein ASZ78_011311, partial [Callipepla squamata]
FTRGPLWLGPAGAPTLIVLPKPTGAQSPPAPAKKPRGRSILQSLFCCLCHDDTEPFSVNNNAPLLVEENGTVPKAAVKHLLPEIKPQDASKLCVVIDLDETLVHSSFKPVNNADFIIPVEIDGVMHQVWGCAARGWEERGVWWGASPPSRGWRRVQVIQDRLWSGSQPVLGYLAPEPARCFALEMPGTLGTSLAVPKRYPLIPAWGMSPPCCWLGLGHGAP